MEAWVIVFRVLILARLSGLLLNKLGDTWTNEDASGRLQCIYFTLSLYRRLYWGITDTQWTALSKTRSLTASMRMRHSRSQHGPASCRCGRASTSLSRTSVGWLCTNLFVSGFDSAPHFQIYLCCMCQYGIRFYCRIIFHHRDVTERVFSLLTGLCSVLTICL